MHRSKLFAVTSGLFLSHSLFAATVPVTAIFSCPTIAPGGTAQITVSFRAPQAITAGSFSTDLDPAVFGSLTAVHVFSATGDQERLAVVIKSLHADVQFGSNTGGIGRLPDISFAEISAAVLSTAPNPYAGNVTVSPLSVWHEVCGLQYTISFQSLGVPIGANRSIQGVAPGSCTI